MKKILLILLALISFPAFAEVKYIVGRDGAPKDAGEAADPDEAWRLKRFYVSGGYNFHFPNDIHGADASSGGGNLTGAMGLFISESWRAELSYENLRDRYGGARVDGNFGFANFIFDAKIPADYMMFKQNPLVAFVGFGAGGGMFDLGRGASLDRDFSYAYDLIGGVSLEINRTVAFQLAYKYVRLLPNELNVNGNSVSDFAPSSHNLAVSFRMNF